MGINLVEFNPEQKYLIYLRVWYYWHPEDQTTPDFEDLVTFYYESLINDMVRVCCFVITFAALQTLAFFIIVYVTIWIIRYLIETDPLHIFGFIKKKSKKYNDWEDDEKLKPLNP